MARLAISTARWPSTIGRKPAINLAGQLLELFHGRRAARIERGEQDFLLVNVLNAFGEFGGGGGFARALQARHQNRDRRLTFQRQAGGLALTTEQINQGVVDDLDDLLARRDRSGSRLRQ